MANENYPLKHVVVPVLHPDSGEVHDIAVPASTPMSDLHDALASDYHVQEPTAQGSVENSPAFRKAANQALGLMRASELRREIGHEAGFTVNQDGSTSKVDLQADEMGGGAGHMTQIIPDNALGALHTHDANHKDTPSPKDVKAAQASRKTIYVASRSGLWSIDPSGQISNVYRDQDWASKK